MTLKDHKENFQNHPKCRLIKPPKFEIGKISKQHLDSINTQIRKKSGFKQRKNTASTLSWFNNIPNKADCKFLKFDLVDFYPSVSEKLLTDAIEYANKFVKIDKSTEIIMHCRKSPLFCEGEAWSKKSYGRFDVTMGSFDGAEVCELVGLYLLHHLSGILGKEAVGLCRDDGLAILRNTLGPNAERLKKQIIQIFHQHDLKDAILVRTDFLDETLDLSSGRYWPYQKPNDHPLYIDIRSNHPPTIKRQLPSMTEKRLSQISCDKSEFQTAIPMYEQALQASGHHQKLQFQQEQANQGRRTRERNITWFNPPTTTSSTLT